MLQQTTVRAVEPKYREFIRRFPRLAALARAPIDRVLAAWSGLGYYRRARHLRAAARLVMKRHAGRFPDRLGAAMALPGVGRYTAGAILSIAYGLPHPVVDGNVARVLSRLHRLRGPRGRPAPASRIWAIAGALIEKCGHPGDLNQALMELGATVCVPRAPRCATCPIRRPCGARAAGLQDSIPPARRRPAPRPVRVEVAIVARAGRFLLRRRRGTLAMDGLWELPTLQDRDGLRFHAGAPVAEIRHAIMDRRYTVVARRARLAAPAPRGRCRWVAWSDLGRIPTSSLVGKVLAAVSSRTVSASRTMS
jgi:A/G-specific adenine glycosylase